MNHFEWEGKIHGQLVNAVFIVTTNATDEYLPVLNLESCFDFEDRFVELSKDETEALEFYCAEKHWDEINEK